MMGERQAQTGIEGTFMLANSLSRQYRLEASRKGFTSVVRPNIFVKVNSTAIANLQLENGGVAAEIVIEEQRNVIDTESGNQGSGSDKKNSFREFLLGRSYQQAAQLAVGVTGGSNPTSVEHPVNENTYLMDGVNITDPVTYLLLNFNFDAIEQIQVLSSAYDPEFGQKFRWCYQYCYKQWW